MESTSLTTEKLKKIEYAPQVYKIINLTQSLHNDTYEICTYLYFLDFWSSCNLLKYFQSRCIEWLYNNSTTTMAK